MLAGVVGSGTFDVRQQRSLNALNGDLSLRNDNLSGSIRIGSNTAFFATSSVAAKGNIRVSILDPNESCPASNPACIPAGVTIAPLSDTSKIFFGANGCVSVNTVITAATRKVVSNTNTAAASSITMLGAAAFTVN
ncbi:MAG TPA: hypothetical protein V6D17_09725 [Candidatus Obscuribacterales bacterium]